METFEILPPISHLFFADEILLFETTSTQQANTMKNIMADFVHSQGKKVNLNKSAVWFSQNVPKGIRPAINREFREPISKTLGTYLVVPCLHKIVSKSTYDDLVLMKVRSILSGWRMKTLSRSTMAILIQHVVSIIPTYIMQAASLPCSTVA